MDLRSQGVSGGNGDLELAWVGFVLLMLETTIRGQRLAAGRDAGPPRAA